LWISTSENAPNPVQTFGSRRGRALGVRWTGRGSWPAAYIAELVAFLASDRAQWITASNFKIDGGQL
jgi:NAD(P)-dependent dehydrogenase (short-subunit alcohol dehydrogenase family)